MRRRLAIIGAVTLALLIPAAALAGFAGEYHGTFESDGNTQIAFDIDKVNGKRKIRHISIYAPFACYDGTSGRNSIFVDGGLRIRDGRFAGVRDAGTKGVSGSVELRGRVLDADTVKGTMRALVTTPSTTCYTGLLRWDAQRSI